MFTAVPFSVLTVPPVIPVFPPLLLTAVPFSELTVPPDIFVVPVFVLLTAVPVPWFSTVPPFTFNSSLFTIVFVPSPVTFPCPLTSTVPV